MTDPTGPPRSPGSAEFQAAFRSEFGYVWKTLRRLGVREADLPDVTHDVFVAFYRRLAEYDRARPLKPWLFGIAYRVASDHRRLARHAREVPNPVADPPDPASGIEADLEARRARSLVLRALQDVADERRPVLVMHDIEGFAMPEIAEALGIPLNTGYSRLRLARAEFAVAVRKFGETGGAS